MDTTKAKETVVRFLVGHRPDIYDAKGYTLRELGRVAKSAIFLGVHCTVDRWGYANRHKVYTPW